MKEPKGDPKLEDLKPPPRTIAINPKPKGELKAIGGSMADDWNLRLLNGVGGLISRCSSPESPIAVRAAFRRVVSAASDTIRPFQMALMRSSLLTTRSRLRIR